MISRREFIQQSAVATGAMSWLPSFSFFRHSASPHKPKNVLFLVVDDLKPLLGAYGVPGVFTPNMDRLAASGVLFTHCYCQQAVCGPSRASLLTGLRPDETQVIDLKTYFRDKVPGAVTLPQHFREHGYRTEGMGKVFHGNADVEKSWDTWWGDGTGKPFDYAGAELHAECDRAKKEAEEKGLSGAELRRYVSQHAPRPATECADVPDDAYGDGGMALKAVERLAALGKGDKPFFLAVGFIRPHLPFSAPKKYWDLYDPDNLPMPAWRKAPEGAPPYALQASWEVREFSDYPDNVQPPAMPEAFTPEQERRLLHGYYACVSYVDAQVGLVLDALERLHLSDDTIVCLWGDHGWHLGDHGMWGKFTNYEQATRSPLIIRAPGIKGGAGCDAVTELVDVYPTLCDLTNTPEPAGLAGASLAGLMAKPDMKWNRLAFSQYPRTADEGTEKQREVMGYSLRTPRYRYTEWVYNPAWGSSIKRRHPQPGNVVLDRELYDYQTDPDETKNLIMDPACQEIRAQLEQRMQKGLRNF